MLGKQTKNICHLKSEGKSWSQNSTQIIQEILFIHKPLNFIN